MWLAMPLVDSRPLLIGMIVLRLVVAIIAVEKLLQDPVRDSDVLRFHEIGNARGTPYLDYDVEYAPLELLGLRLVAGSTAAATGVRLVILALIADLSAAAGLAWGWGRRSAMAYLLLGSPLLLFIYLRFDPVVVALAVWGAAMARRRYESAAGIGLGAASLMKVWPVVIVPALLFSPKKKAILATVVVWLVGSASWILLTSRSAASQVLSFRGATGWGAESPVGTLVWLITGGPTRLENGAPRVGVVPPWATTVLAIALVATVTAIWVRARGRRVDSFGTPALGAMGALLTFSPLFSLQYVGWLLPWAAIAHQDGDHRAMPVTMMVSVATASLFVLYAADQLAWAQVLLIIRAVAVGGLAVSALRRDVAPGAERATG